jgi:hypothetical protein
MVKLVYCIRRKQGLSRDEFQRYWAEVHEPIGARIPSLRKLVQSHAIADEAHFVDPVGCASFVSEERQILATGGGVHGAPT